MKLPEFNDKANTLGPLRGLLYLVCVLLCLRMDWSIAARCTKCGHGCFYATPGIEGRSITGPHRWLCVCGADWGQSVTWVGRKTYGVDVWEWKPFDELPEDIQADYKTAPPAPDPSDLDARVRAQVEVALVAALAKHEATCNCRKAP